MHRLPLAEKLRDLQGKVVPHLRAAGYWLGGMHFVLVTDHIAGTHPDRSDPATPSLLPVAEQVGVWLVVLKPLRLLTI